MSGEEDISKASNSVILSIYVVISWKSHIWRDRNLLEGEPHLYLQHVAKQSGKSLPLTRLEAGINGPAVFEAVKILVSRVGLSLKEIKT